MKASWYSQRSKAPHSSDAFKVSLVKKKKKTLNSKNRNELHVMLKATW